VCASRYEAVQVVDQIFSGRIQALVVIVKTSQSCNGILQRCLVWLKS
jgi:hypothetical protein